MKKLMIIGTVHTDLCASVRTLPKGNEDPEILSMTQSVSGGGYKAALVYEKLGFPYELLCDPGTGVYGDFARKTAGENGISVPSLSEAVGGCTYRMMDAEGNEGVFLVEGSEYDFSIDMLDGIYADEIGAFAVFSGMLAGQGAEDIIEVLREVEAPVYFICDERAAELDEDVLEVLFALRPVMLIHDSDAAILCGDDNCSLDEAADRLSALIGNDVIILRSDGACFADGNQRMIAPREKKTDAGTYAGAYIAARTAGVDCRNSLMFAGEQTGNADGEQMKKRLAHMITYRKRD